MASLTIDCTDTYNMKLADDCAIIFINIFVLFVCLNLVIKVHVCQIWMGCVCGWVGGCVTLTPTEL